MTIYFPIDKIRAKALCKRLKNFAATSPKIEMELALGLAHYTENKDDLRSIAVCYGWIDKKLVPTSIYASSISPKDDKFAVKSDKPILPDNIGNNYNLKNIFLLIQEFLFNYDKDQLQKQTTPGSESGEHKGRVYGGEDVTRFTAGRHCDQGTVRRGKGIYQRCDYILSSRCGQVYGIN